MIIRGVLKLVARVVGGIVSRAAAAAKKQPKGCEAQPLGGGKEAAGVVAFPTANALKERARRWFRFYLFISRCKSCNYTKTHKTEIERSLKMCI